MKILIPIWIVIVAVFAIGFATDWKKPRFTWRDDEKIHPPR